MMKYFLLATISLLAATSSPADLSPAERTQASDLYKKFVAAKDDLPARTKVVKEMSEMGLEVAKVIHPVIDREFRTSVDRYRSGYLTTAKQVASKKTSSEQLNRIKKLRATVQSLRGKADLSKEDVQKIGDPAVAELRKLTKLTRKEIMDASEKLGEARSDLVELAKQREMTIDAMVLIELETFGTKELEAEEEQMASGAMSLNGEARAVLAQNRKLASDVEPAEAEGIANLNELRILVGLRPCLIDPKLCAAARGHSKDMAEKKFFAHESPVPGKTSPGDRAKLEGTTSNSENIFAGSPSGAAANKAWWYSPGHHKNMLNPSPNRVAMGVYGKHWTQMFGR